MERRIVGGNGFRQNSHNIFLIARQKQELNITGNYVKSGQTLGAAKVPKHSCMYSAKVHKWRHMGSGGAEVMPCLYVITD